MICSSCERFLGNDGETLRCPRCGGWATPELEVGFRLEGDARIGSLSVMRVVLQSRGDELHDARIEVASALLKSNVRRTIGRLARYAKRDDILLDIELVRPGSGTIEVMFSAKPGEGREAVGFAGQGVIDVAEKATGPTNVTITADKIMATDINVGRTRQHVELQEIKLRYSEMVTRHRRAGDTIFTQRPCPYCHRSSPKTEQFCPFCGNEAPSFVKATPARGLNNAPVAQSAALVCQRTGWRIVVLTRPEVGLGRQPANDFQLLLPRSPANDKLSKRISRIHHCRVVIENEVPVVYFKYPVQVNGVDVAQLPIIGQNIVPVAGVMELACESWCVGQDEQPYLLGMRATPRMLDSATGPPFRAELLLLPRWVNLGCRRNDAPCPVGPHEDGICRLVHDERGLWFEALKDEMLIRIGEHIIPRGELAPVNIGSTVSCGPLLLRVQPPFAAAQQFNSGPGDL